MKKIIVIVCTLILTIAVYCVYKKQNENKMQYVSENDILLNKCLEQSEENNEEEKKQITIYDIEDGYLTVDYNELADKNTFNWSNNLNTDGKYYRYEDGNYTTKVGIDVSNFQGNINWKEVKDAGIQFAIIRLGYRGYGKSGGIVLDSRFEEYYEGATSVGLDVGVYFFSQAINMDEVKEEAQFIFKNIEGKEIKYPIVFDLEKIKYDTARTDNLTRDEITNMMLEFCKIIEKSGYVPCIYGNAKTFTTKTKLELFNNYCKWYADYQKEPLYPYEFDMWQYTEKGKIDGVEGDVDIDIYFSKKE